MAAIDDLKTEVQNLNASFSAELAAINNKLSTSPVSNDPAIVEVTASLKSLQDKVDAETAVLTAPSTSTPSATPTV